MESKIDLSNNFDLSDDPKFARKIRRDFTLIFLSTIIGIAFVLTVICHADKIDFFFARLLSEIFYGPDKERYLFVWIVITWLSFLHATRLHRTRWGVRSFIKFILGKIRFIKSSGTGASRFLNFKRK